MRDKLAPWFGLGFQGQNYKGTKIMIFNDNNDDDDDDDTVITIIIIIIIIIITIATTTIVSYEHYIISFLVFALFVSNIGWGWWWWEQV